MQCPICRGEEKWKNIDEFRVKPEGMSMCETCGFISYPKRYKTKEEILKYYETDYRNAPSANNIFTGERKLHYHAHFLVDVFNAWRAEGKTKPVYSDIGAAFGMTLNWLRGHFPEADLNGVELTKSFVRNAWHMFQVRLDKDFDDSKEYDLILSYKSLEHIMDPDVELRRYIKALKPDGYLYISVPLWFESMRNFGLSGFDTEYYYSPDHINTWSKKQFEGLLKVCGGKIVKVNRTYYGDSYLVQRDDSLLSSNRQECYEDPSAIMENLKKIFAANEAYQTQNFAEAIKIWPNFPSAWFNYYEMNRKQLHELGFEFIDKEVIDASIAACPNEADMRRFSADICTRYERYEEALEHLRIRNEMTPGMPDTFSMFGTIFRELSKRAKSPADKVRFLKEAKNVTEILKQVSSQTYAEAMNWIMLDNSKIPTQFEVENG